MYYKNKTSPFLSIASLKSIYITPGISSKSHKLVINIVWRILCMIEYMYARVRVNNFTMFTVVNLIGRVGTMSLLEMESTM